MPATVWGRSGTLAGNILSGWPDPKPVRTFGASRVCPLIRVARRGQNDRLICARSPQP
jgi:hypothetical protein